MIGSALLALALTAGFGPPHLPGSLTVSTPGGTRRIAVRSDAAGAPLLPAAALADALSGTLQIDSGWARFTVAASSFRFLMGAPLYVLNDQVEPLAAAAVVLHDSLFVPFQFAAEVLPSLPGGGFRYEARSARLTQRSVVASLPATAPAPTPARAEPARLASGLLPGHLVTIDPGHGGVDPGNPGLFFPHGVREKDVTLQIGLLLRDELRKRGVGVRMTRTTDTLIALGDRGGYCTDNCDLFVSIHINSLPRRSGYTDVHGFETYFLAEAKTEDAARVARMENDAMRYEPPSQQSTATGLDFILKDLQLNEHLRESAHAADLIQTSLGHNDPAGDRGVKQAGFMVLTTARRPAVLAELGYSTNPADGRRLTERASQRRIASALADAVVAYLLDYERKTGAAGDSGTAVR